MDMRIGGLADNSYVELIIQGPWSLPAREEPTTHVTAGHLFAIQVDAARDAPFVFDRPRKLKAVAPYVLVTVWVEARPAGRVQMAYEAPLYRIEGSPVPIWGKGSSGYLLGASARASGTDLNDLPPDVLGLVVQAFAEADYFGVSGIRDAVDRALPDTGRSPQV